jgi:effector-binding domain-containing protein
MRPYVAAAEDSRVNYDIRLEQHAGIPLAVVRRHANRRDDLSKIIPDACGAVWKVVRSHPIPGAGRHVAVYRDDQINLEIGVELEAPFAGVGEVVGSSTPAGLVATTTHFGPYGGLYGAHSAIQQWCRINGHRLAGPCWELYGHWQDDWNRDPSQIRTDVFYRLAEGSAA